MKIAVIGSKILNFGKKFISGAKGLISGLNFIDVIKKIGSLSSVVSSIALGVKVLKDKFLSRKKVYSGSALDADESPFERVMKVNNLNKNMRDTVEYKPIDNEVLRDLNSNFVYTTLSESSMPEKMAKEAKKIKKAEKKAEEEANRPPTRYEKLMSIIGDEHDVQRLMYHLEDEDSYCIRMAKLDPDQLITEYAELDNLCDKYHDVLPTYERNHMDEKLSIMKSVVSYYFAGVEDSTFDDLDVDKANTETLYNFIEDYDEEFDEEEEYYAGFENPWLTNDWLGHFEAFGY